MTLQQFKTVGYADLSSSGRSIRVRIHGQPDLYINATTLNEILNRHHYKAAGVYILQETPK